jgi:hypothetical protein
MKQEKIAQDKKRETYRSISEVETVREDSKKLLSPKGAIEKNHAPVHQKHGM